MQHKFLRAAWAAAIVVPLVLTLRATTPPGAAISTRSSVPQAQYGIEVSSGPAGLGNHPFPDGNAPGYGWNLKVTPAVDPPAVITSVKTDQGVVLANNCFTGGLNGSVGSVQIKRDCMPSGVKHFTVTFSIQGVDHRVNIVNPVSRNWVVVDFLGLLTLEEDQATFAVEAVNDRGDVIANYNGTVWVTAFSLSGSRLRLDGLASARAPVELEDGRGHLTVHILQRVPGDTVIFEIEAPRLDTARSAIGL